MEAPTTLEQYVGIALSAAKDNEAGIFLLQERMAILEKIVNDDIYFLYERNKKLERKLWKKKHKKKHK